MLGAAYPAVMPTKRSIIDDALANTANNLSVDTDQTADTADQTAEWRNGSRAYDREIRILLQRHPWSFAKETAALDQADEDDNPSNRYGYAYEWPYGALWLQKVEVPGGAGIEYEIIGQYICTDYDGTDDDAPIATYVVQPQASDISDLFFECLRTKVEVSLLRSLNEDYGEANARDKMAEQMLLPLARTRTDQQAPKRRAFKSRILERRRAGGGPSVL